MFKRWVEEEAPVWKKTILSGKRETGLHIIEEAEGREYFRKEAAIKRFKCYSQVN